MCRVANPQADGEGFEADSVTACESSKLHQLPKTRAAKFDVIGVEIDDSELLTVIDSWQYLNDLDRQQVLTIVAEAS